jgi:hypothetical protein
LRHRLARRWRPGNNSVVQKVIFFQRKMVSYFYLQIPTAFHNH